MCLLERNHKPAGLQEVPLALTSIGSPLRATSEQVAYYEYQSALESSHLGGNKIFKDSFNNTFVGAFSLVIEPEPEFQHPEPKDCHIEKMFDSHQTTPDTSTFPAGIKDSTEHQVDLTSKDTKETNSSLVESTPQNGAKMNDLAPFHSCDSLPTKPSSAQDAALGLLGDVTTAASVRRRSPSPAGYDSDFMGGDLDQETIDAAAAFAPPPTAEPTTPDRSTVTRARASTLKKGRKGRSIDISAETPKQLTAEDRRRIRELDTAAVVEDWFADPVQVPKLTKEKKNEPPAPIPKAAPDPILLRRDNKGHGKKKRKGKSKKGSISMPSELPAHTPANESNHPILSSSPATESRAANDGETKEPLQQEAEHDTLQPTFADAGEEPNDLSTTIRPPSQPSPTKITAEVPSDVSTMGIVADKSLPIAIPNPELEPCMTLHARKFDNTEIPSIEPTQEQASGLESKLTSPSGWECNKSQSSDHEPNDLVMEPVVVQVELSLPQRPKKDEEDKKTEFIDSEPRVQKCTTPKDSVEQPPALIEIGASGKSSSF